MNSPDASFQFDWGLVHNLDPQSILKQSEVKLVRSFVKMILNTDFECLSPSAFSNPSFPKLLLLIQATIEFLLRSQKELKNLLNDAAKKYSEAAEEISKLEQSENNSRKLLHTLQTQGETCPLCGKRFKTLAYIDKHINNRHAEFAEAWSAIRSNNSAFCTHNNSNKSGSKPNNRSVKSNSRNFQLIHGDTLIIKAPPQKVYEPTDIEVVEAPILPEIQINKNNNIQVPPLPKPIKSPASPLDVFENGQPYMAPNNSEIVTKGQIDSMANRAAGNIIKEMTEIAQTHKKHHSTPQTPTTPAATPTTPAATPTTPTSNHSHAHKHNGKATDPQQQQQQPSPIQSPSVSKQPEVHSNESQKTNRASESTKPNRQAETPPASSKRKVSQQLQDNESQKTNRAHRSKRASSVDTTPRTSEIPSKSSSIIEASQQSQQQASPIKLQEADPFIMASQGDPFLIDNEESPDSSEEEDDDANNIRTSQQVDFTNAELDELIPRSDNEDEEVVNDIADPISKKKRRKHRKAAAVPEEHLPAINEQEQQQPEVKFNFHGTNNKLQQQQLQQQQQVGQADKVQAKISSNKVKKPSVTFINAEEENEEQHQQQKQETIGILKRTDVYQQQQEEEYEDVPPAKQFQNQNEEEQPKRMGGYQITNSELDELIPESSECE